MELTISRNNDYTSLQTSLISFSIREISSSSSDFPNLSSKSAEDGIPSETAILSTISGCGQESRFSI